MNALYSILNGSPSEDFHRVENSINGGVKVCPNCGESESTHHYSCPEAVNHRLKIIGEQEKAFKASIGVPAVPTIEFDAEKSWSFDELDELGDMECSECHEELPVRYMYGNKKPLCRNCTADLLN